MQKNWAHRGQAFTDYLVVMLVMLVLALIVLGIGTGLPGIGQSIQSTNQLNYWTAQARPFTVAEAFYRNNNSRFYLALEVQQNDAFNLTGLFINGTQLSFSNYDPSTSDGVGAGQCSSSDCQLAPCSCDDPMRPYAPGEIVTEPYFSTLGVCGPTRQQSPLSVQLVYFRASDPTRNLTETSSVLMPFSCQ